MKKNKLYRLTLFEDATHRRLGFIRFSKSGAIAGLVASLVLFAGLIYCIVAFTPMRTTIPGYPDAYSRKIAIENALKIDSLENAIARWELYTENLSRVLLGEPAVSLDSVVMGNVTKYLKNVSEEQMQRQDSLLRQSMKEKECVE